MSQGTRKLAAIMFTDMVGYTALGERNETLSLALVEEQRKVVRPVLARHNGREVKTIGDGFLVEFPNAIDAVRCAYDIQRAIREFNLSLASENRIQLKIGIHLGEVIEHQGDISGAAVNVASRIESLAGDGGVCITRQVYDHVHNKVDLPLSSLGSKSLKNVAGPVEVYRIVMPWEDQIATPSLAANLDRRRIAILPFMNYSPDPNDAYFADGITEEIISIASNVSGLIVISRTSVMGYKGTTKNMKQIGHELGAGSVVEGSFRKAGNKIRVTAQLVDVNDDSHIWAQSYDRNLDDVFAVQSDIALHVANALRVKIKPWEETRVKEAPTNSAEAYTFYMKGKLYLADQGRKASLHAAIGQFERALEMDPDYAQAYCGLSFAHRDLAFHELANSMDEYESAERLARKALELDDSLGEAHMALAFPLLNWYDYQGAISELKKGIELNPNLAEAYRCLATVYSYLGRWNDCFEALDQDLRLDPFSVESALYAGTAYLYSGQYDKSIEYLKRALILEPDNVFGLGNLGLAHIKKGLVEIGLDELERASRLAGPMGDWSGSADLAYAYVKAGRPKDARQVLEALLASGKNGHMSTSRIAGVYAVLGENEKALEWLQKAYEARSGYIVALRDDFVFEGIRDEPRFQTLMRKMGLDRLESK